MILENIKTLTKEQLINEYSILYNSIHKNESILELYVTLNSFIKNISEQIKNANLSITDGDDKAFDRALKFIEKADKVMEAIYRAQANLLPEEIKKTEQVNNTALTALNNIKNGKKSS